MKIFNLNMKRRFTYGFTLVEILVVIAIAAMLATIVVASLSNFRASGNMRVATDELVSILDDARSATLALGGRHCPWGAF